MKTKTAASFIASTMSAGLIAGALMAAPAEAMVTSVANTTTPTVQTAGATSFVTGCGWRRRCCRRSCGCRNGCGCRRSCGCGNGCGWRSWRWSSWSNWGGDWGGNWWW